MQAQIAIPHSKLAALCQRHRSHWLALFGSVLSGGFGPSSDVDVLVEFEPDAIFGRRVDVGTPDMLSPFIAQRVMSGLQTIYGDIKDDLLRLQHMPILA
jgi:predicted nucleotidyltransferase